MVLTRRGLFLKPFIFCLVIVLLTLSPFMGVRADAAVFDWQKGGSFYPKSPEDYGSKNYKESVDNLDDVGANYVGLLVPYYQTDAQSVTMERGWNTPTDKALVKGIKYAHERGLKVFLVIHVDCKSQEWRAVLDPYDRNLWFKNYGALLNKYAEIGDKYGVELYSLGTELYNMASVEVDADNDTQWKKLIGQVRKRYHGKLTYGANHSTPTEKFEVNFWPLLDYIGVSAYYPLTEPGATPEERLHNSWEKVNQEHIKPLTKYGKPILFTELGYGSVENSSHMPYAFDTTKQVDVDEQARNYKAVFEYWDNYDYIAGWHVWAWEIDPKDGGIKDGKFTPQHKPAENVLRSWYHKRRPLQPVAFVAPLNCQVIEPRLSYLFKDKKVVAAPYMIAQDTAPLQVAMQYDTQAVPMKLTAVTR